MILKKELNLNNTTSYLDFEIFKSTYLHRLKKSEPKTFVNEIIKENKILYYYNNQEYLYANYLYALCKYLNKKFNLNKEIMIPKIFLPEKLVFPSDTYLQAYLSNDTSYLYDAYNKAISEFLKFNIVEVCL